ncbi:hypothetical protein N7524_012361 [Penicillium chrysogenum]|nr:hypothetical protein N7524_012361 [Penicillium chrysogenum]
MASSSAPSLANLAFDEICRQLEVFVAGKKSVCVVSSSIPSKTTVSPPVRICWRTDADNILRELTLPLDSQADSKAESGLRQLVVDCEPASFGKGQQDVLDPKYRKAGKLEPRSFLTSFHPSDLGILQNVEQILLPNFNTDLENRLPFRKMHAELYKLNVYSGPSGLFRKHVDTPRSETQIGSLVVCLPSHFKGGNLVVQHEGKRVEFDWSHQSASAIQWAAFYSDCEHEIKTITEGERITLTYNLYSMSLYSFLEELLVEPGFMTDGGALGFFCSHAYPHASDEAPMLLPRALKGSDLVLYSVFKSLGIQIDVLPVAFDDHYDQCKEKHVLVGDQLHPYFATDEIEEDESMTELCFPGEYRPEITWIGSPTHSQEAVSYIAYGNQPSLGAVYSYAALVANIPPFLERKGLVLA